MSTKYLIPNEVDGDKILPFEEMSVQQHNPAKRTYVKNKSIKRKQTVKRCRKGHRRNPKTHRCNVKCPPTKKRNPKTKRCINRKKLRT